jgi:hypothetical protein
MDELVELGPEERRARLERAVAEGDVRAGEVEQALRIVGRLDAVKVMTIPGLSGGRVSYAAGLDEGPEAVSAEETAHQSEVVRSGGRHARAARRAAIDIAAETMGFQGEPGGIAAEVTARPSRTVAAAHMRKAGRAVGGSPRRRRMRRAAAARGSRIRTALEPVAQPVTGKPDAAEEQWPSIAWLRP